MKVKNWKEPAIRFNEVLITYVGTDENGKEVIFLHKHKIAPLSSVQISATRPVTMRKGKATPSPFVFHNINFVTKK